MPKILHDTPDFNRQHWGLTPPQPGQIWEIQRSPRQLVQLSKAERTLLYSDVAQAFLDSPEQHRYVLIITEPDLPTQDICDGASLQVMLLSPETEFINSVDLLISTELSGLGCDLLAEAWHVVPMLMTYLSKPVGQRLSRGVYDLLLDIRDAYHRQQAIPTTYRIQKTGLQFKIPSVEQDFAIHTFHQREIGWSDILTVPVATYRAATKAIAFTEKLLTQSAQIKQPQAIASEPSQIYLTQWLQGVVEPGWQAIKDWLQQPNWAIAVRSHEPDRTPHPAEIATLLEQLSHETQEHQRQKIAEQLAQLVPGHPDAIQALVDLVQTTRNDEALWAAVQSLWQIAPGHPAAGTRKVRLIDLGIQVSGQAVALAVALVQTVQEQANILIQVYPNENQAFLPLGLKLMLLNPAGNPLREVTARRADVCIQLKFKGATSEAFGVKIALGRMEIMENFVI
jgi:Protein of unknown function (DUF1822)